MVNEDAALLNRRVTHMTPAALFSRRLQLLYQLSYRGNKLILSRPIRSQSRRHILSESKGWRQALT
jgi:hypothetical protein